MIFKRNNQQKNNSPADDKLNIIAAMLEDYADGYASLPDQALLVLESFSLLYERVARGNLKNIYLKSNKTEMKPENFCKLLDAIAPHVDPEDVLFLRDTTLLDSDEGMLMTGNSLFFKFDKNRAAIPLSSIAFIDARIETNFFSGVRELKITDKKGKEWIFKDIFTDEDDMEYLWDALLDALSRINSRDKASFTRNSNLQNLKYKKDNPENMPSSGGRDAYSIAHLLEGYRHIANHLSALEQFITQALGKLFARVSAHDLNNIYLKGKKTDMKPANFTKLLDSIAPDINPEDVLLLRDTTLRDADEGMIISKDALYFNFSKKRFDMRFADIEYVESKVEKGFFGSQVLIIMDRFQHQWDISNLFAEAIELEYLADALRDIVKEIKSNKSRQVATDANDALQEFSKELRGEPEQKGERKEIIPEPSEGAASSEENDAFWEFSNSLLMALEHKEEMSNILPEAFESAASSKDKLTLILPLDDSPLSFYLHLNPSSGVIEAGWEMDYDDGMSWMYEEKTRKIQDKLTDLLFKPNDQSNTCDLYFETPLLPIEQDRINSLAKKIALSYARVLKLAKDILSYRM